MVRQELAWVAGNVITAVTRRADTAEESLQRRLSGVVSVLDADYPPGGTAEPGRIAGLADVFGLDGLDAQLLAVAVAVELDANIGLAYELLTGEGGGPRPSVGLALELCSVPTATATGFIHLGAGSALRRNGLLDVVGNSAWLQRRLVVPDPVTAFLAGDDQPPPAVTAVLADAVPVAGPAATQVARALRDGAELVWMRGVLGTSGASFALAGVTEVGLDALVVDAGRIAAGEPGGAGAAIADVLMSAARQAAFRGRALIVTGADVLAEHPQCFELLAGVAVPVVAVGTGAWQRGWLRRVPLTVDAPLLTAEQRAQLWAREFGDAAHVPDRARGRLALTSLRLTPEDILATADHARALATARAEPVSAAIVRDAARVVAAGAGSGSSGRVAARAPGPPVAFDDLVLPEHVIADLRRLVRWAVHRDEVLTRGPVHGKGGQGTGITSLFTGSPGTGKTLAAHVIADELNLELFQVELSAVVDKYIGETEKNLERIFHEAESRNVVLFFDEADALFGSRSEVKDARDRYANQEVSYLLQRMEHFDGITVLATNLRGNLDAAFSRRMQFIVHFPDPDEPTRLRLWRRHLDNAGPCDDADPVDVAFLARAVELAGGDIRNIVLAATYDAASDGAPLGMRHIRSAAVGEFRKLGRRAPAGVDSLPPAPAGNRTN